MNARLPGALSAVLALAACAATRDAPDGLASPERDASRTRDTSVYHAMSRPEVQRHMHVLADELLTLVGLTMPEDAPPDAARRDDVVASLDRIEARARRVGGGGVVTNYSVINDYMDGFLEDVALSREFARREPPNLVPANRLVQSCLACHRSL